MRDRLLLNWGTLVFPVPAEKVVLLPRTPTARLYAHKLFQELANTPDQRPTAYRRQAELPLKLHLQGPK